MPEVKKIQQYYFRGENPDFFAYKDGVLQPKQYPSLPAMVTDSFADAIVYATNNSEFEYGYIYVIQADAIQSLELTLEEQQNPNAKGLRLEGKSFLLSSSKFEVLPQESLQGVRRTPSLCVEYSFCGYYNPGGELG